MGHLPSLPSGIGPLWTGVGAFRGFLPLYWKLYTPNYNHRGFLDCEREICADLVGATVIEHRVSAQKRDQECYKIVSQALGVDACMELNLSTGSCTIWYDRSADRATRNHERSHCNGWHHTWDPQKRIYRWFPMPEVLKYDFAASKEAR